MTEQQITEAEPPPDWFARWENAEDRYRTLLNAIAEHERSQEGHIPRECDVRLYQAAMATMGINGDAQ